MTGASTKTIAEATKSIPILGKITREAQRVDKNIIKEAKRPFKKPKIRSMLEPDPSPEPVLMEEVVGAKKKRKKRKPGRGATILAGRMMAGRRNILNTQFKKKLGE